jgi:hypothetical protein
MLGGRSANPISRRSHDCSHIEWGLGLDDKAELGLVRAIELNDVDPLTALQAAMRPIVSSARKPAPPDYGRSRLLKKMVRSGFTILLQLLHD